MRNTDQFVELGDEVEDSVTGFRGIASAATEFLNGCRRIQITPPAKDGTYQDERWLDEPQLRVVQKSAWARPVPEQPRKTGGDRQDCPSK